MIGLLFAALATMTPVQADPKWVLSFQDEFDGPSGAAPSPVHWRHDIGGNGWGNNELESYTDGSANSFLDGNGKLVIEARKQQSKGPDGIERPYSSARIVTKGKFSQRYGRFEARIRLPKGQGVWPAFWLLGDSVDTVGWPDCGEVDILESIGSAAKTVYGTLHGPGYSGQEGIQGTLKTASSIADDYHVYAVEWEPNRIRWFFDKTCYSTVTPAKLKGHKWVFDGPFFIIVNLAIGGFWPGNPDATTEFPQRMLVDYVRVYKKAK